MYIHPGPLWTEKSLSRGMLPLQYIKVVEYRLELGLVGFCLFTLTRTDVQITFLHADTQEHADRIAREVVVTHKSLGPPILTLEKAIENKSFFSSPGRVIEKVGDTEGDHFSRV